MIRALRKFVSYLSGPKRYVFFIVLLLICIVALSLGIYAQFFYKYADTDPLMIGINVGSKKTAEEIAILKSNFNQLFNNSVTGTLNDKIKVSKIAPERDIVYTYYDLVHTDENYYSIDAKIPIVNIDSEVAKGINADIISEFYETANNITRRKEDSTIYKVTYASFINDKILSIVIKSSLKEEGKAEKVVIKTFNYLLNEDRRITIKEMIEAKSLTLASVQNIINDDVKVAYDRAKELAAEYGALYERDLKSDIYKVENTENFFLTQEGYVYIVYAYGNNDYTNDMDIVIF